MAAPEPSRTKPFDAIWADVKEVPKSGKENGRETDVEASSPRVCTLGVPAVVSIQENEVVVQA